MIELAKLKVSNVLSSLPLMFERNMGQHDERVQFILNHKQCTTFFTDTELVLAFRSNEEINGLKEVDCNSIVNTTLNSLYEYKINVLRINFEDSNKIPQIIGENEFNCKLNYFKGNIKSEWKSYIPIYEKLLYKEIYSGIDLLYYGNKGNIKLDFIVQPNKNIDNIKLNFEGADKITIDEEGNLLVKLDNKLLKILKLEAVQEFSKEKIECNFEIEENFKVKFNISNYDNDEILIIKVPFLFETFKAATMIDRGNSITVDNNKCIYITGVTSVQSFPEKSLYKTIYSGKDYSAYIIKIDTRKIGQAALVYGAYLGGNGVDEGVSVAVDYSGVAYVVGTTNSTAGFPTTEKSYLPSYPGGETTGFLVKVNTREVGITSLCYGTYLGGKGNDYIYSIALDKNKNVYIVGDTTSNSRFPITENAYQTSNCENSKDGFLIKLNTNIKGKEALLYGTYLGGSNNDSFYSVAIDSNDYAYITGVTESKDFPITDNGYEKNRYGQEISSFLMKFDVKQNGVEGLLYSSYLGGEGKSIGYSVTVDSNECAYITGITNSSERFPITINAFQNELCTNKETGFLIKLDTKKYGEEGLLYGSYLGGSGINVCSDIKIDCNNYVYISGFTNSKDLPLENYKNIISYLGFYSFLFKLDVSKEGRLALLNGICFGENGYDVALSIAIDNDLNAYITGYSDSIIKNDIKISKGVYKWGSAFLTKISTRVCDLVAERNNNKSFVDIGEKAKYTIKLRNNGPDIAKNVVVTDTLQRGLIVKGVKASKGAVHQIGSELVWRIDKVSPDEELSADITVRVSVKDKVLSSDLRIDIDENTDNYRSGVYERNMYRYLI